MVDSLRKVCLFVCDEVLQTSQPNGVLLRAVSLPTGQTQSSKRLTSIVHSLSPEIDNCPSWISGRECDHRKYFMINLHERMLLSQRVSNLQPPDHQSNAHPSHQGRLLWQVSGVNSTPFFSHVCIKYILWRSAPAMYVFMENLRKYPTIIKSLKTWVYSHAMTPMNFYSPHQYDRVVLNFGDWSWELFGSGPQLNWTFLVYNRSAQHHTCKYQQKWLL